MGGVCWAGESQIYGAASLKKFRRKRTVDYPKSFGIPDFGMMDFCSKWGMIGWGVLQAGDVGI